MLEGKLHRHSPLNNSWLRPTGGLIVFRMISELAVHESTPIIANGRFCNGRQTSCCDRWHWTNGCRVHLSSTNIYATVWTETFGRRAAGRSILWCTFLKNKMVQKWANLNSVTLTSQMVFKSRWWMPVETARGVSQFPSLQRCIWGQRVLRFGDQCSAKCPSWLHCLEMTAERRALLHWQTLTMRNPLMSDHRHWICRTNVSSEVALSIIFDVWFSQYVIVAWNGLLWRGKKDLKKSCILIWLCSTAARIKWWGGSLS